MEELQTPRPRAGDVLRYAVGRPLLFVFWSLILWGTAMLGAFAWKAVAEGPRAALRAAQMQVSEASGWGWVNVALASLSLLVCLLVAGGVLRQRDR